MILDARTERGGHNVAGFNRNTTADESESNSRWQNWAEEEHEAEAGDEVGFTWTRRRTANNNTASDLTSRMEEQQGGTIRAFARTRWQQCRNGEEGEAEEEVELGRGVRGWRKKKMGKKL
uniref:Uncharacterized protein n=1 Tax=Cucumis melo TaxID=3656 RepID=A0A9I9D3T7_CUCME